MNASLFILMCWCDWMNLFGFISGGRIGQHHITVRWYLMDRLELRIEIMENRSLSLFSMVEVNRLFHVNWRRSWNWKWIRWKVILELNGYWQMVCIGLRIVGILGEWYGGIPHWGIGLVESLDDNTCNYYYNLVILFFPPIHRGQIANANLTLESASTESISTPEVTKTSFTTPLWVGHKNNPLSCAQTMADHITRAAEHKFGTNFIVKSLKSPVKCPSVDIVVGVDLMATAFLPPQKQRNYSLGPSFCFLETRYGPLGQGFYDIDLSGGFRSNFYYRMLLGSWISYVGFTIFILCLSTFTLLGSWLARYGFDRFFQYLHENH